MIVGATPMVRTVICGVAMLPLVCAAEQKPAPAAPIPAQILAAKRVFVANAGGDQGSYPDAAFSGGPDRAYNSFYAAMKTWGHFELVAAPSDADLLLEIRFSVRPGLVYKGSTQYWDARFRLVIREAKTQAMLWAITEQVGEALLQGNRDKNFDQALARVMSDLQRLTLQSTYQGSPGEKP